MSDTTALTLRLPADLHSRLRQQAEREGSTINGFVKATLVARLDNSEPTALDARDQMESLARAWQDHDSRLGRLEALARQSGADL